MGKGGEFERAICKELSLWWSGGKSNAIFWRTAGSGARATVRHQQGLETPNSCGDFCAIDPDGFPLVKVISGEFKRGYSGQLHIQSLLDSTQKEPPLLKFWQQAEKDKEVGDRRWSWLIFKRDRCHACIVFDRSFWNFLLRYIGSIDHSAFTVFFQLKGTLGRKHYFLYVMRLSEFFDWLDPEIFRAYAAE